MRIISIREQQLYAKDAIAYFQKCWASEENKMVYEDCILSCLNSDSPLPQWYLLLEDDQIIGCAGLVTNDFISRMDLWPWLCALYIEEEHRGHSYGNILIGQIKKDAKRLGFSSIYLSTDLIGYYERYGFEKIGTGFHPWGESSSIYSARAEE